MILPPKQNPNRLQIFMSMVAVGGNHYTEVRWGSYSPSEIKGLSLQWTDHSFANNYFWVQAHTRPVTSDMVTRSYSE